MRSGNAFPGAGRAWEKRAAVVHYSGNADVRAPRSNDPYGRASERADPSAAEVINLSALISVSRRRPPWNSGDSYLGAFYARARRVDTGELSESRPRVSVIRREPTAVTSGGHCGAGRAGRRGEKFFGASKLDVKN